VHALHARSQVLNFGVCIRLRALKLRERSLCKGISSVTTGLVAVALSFSLFFPVNATSAEYYTFTVNGSSMYPTIAEGDRVKIRFCVNGTLINVDDIIAYSTIVAGVDTGYMLICHRVIEKYRKGDTWFFKTKGDNCPEADFYEVPEYWLFGVVVSIEQTERSDVHAKTSSQTEPSQTEYSTPLFIQEPQTVLLTAGILGIATSIAILSSRRSKRKGLLKNVNIYSCYTCKHYKTQYVYRVQSTDGRVGIRKILNFSRGFCKYFNQDIIDFPKRNCKQYEPKDYT